MRVLWLLFVVLVLSCSLMAQVEQPQYIAFAGGGWDHYAPAGTRAVVAGGFAARLRSNVYSWNTILAKSNGARLLTGFASQLYDEEYVKLYAIAQAGGESTDGDVNLSLATGGVAEVYIGKLIKIPNVYLMGTVTIAKGGATTDAVKPGFGIGISWHSK